MGRPCERHGRSQLGRGSAAIRHFRRGLRSGDYLCRWIQLYRERQKLIESLDVNWLEQTFVDIGYSIEEAKANFEQFENSLVDGLSRAIAQGESLKEVFDNILDMLAQMVIKQAIIQPLVGGVLGFAGITAHTGGLITDNGLKPVSQALQEYHGGGWIGAEPLKPNEEIVKAEHGELMLTEEQQAQLFGGRGGGETYNININAVDAKSFNDLVSRNPEAITSVVTRDISRNGPTRKAIKKNV